MAKSYKELSYKELLTKRDELYRELVNFRFKKKLGHLEDRMAIKNTRHNIARLSGRITELERSGEAAKDSAPVDRKAKARK